jgi:hypothetical protein
MQHEQLINDLLDGELDSAGEAALFGQLAIDSELRSEFMQLMMIHNAVQDDRATLVPPVPLTSAVFAGLGFAAPIAGAAAGAAAMTHSGGFMTTWLAKIGIPLMAALASAGITLAVMTNAEGAGSGGGLVSEMSQQSSASGQPPSSESAHQSMAVATARNEHSQEPVAERVAERVVERIVERVSPVDAMLMSENENLRRQVAELQANIAPRQTKRSTEDALTQIVPSAFTSTLDIRRMESDRVLVAERLTPISAPMNVPAFSLNVRGLSGQSGSLAVTPQTGWYDNLSLAMLYRMTPTDAVGVEIGSESFPMVFSGIRNQQEVRFEIQPLVTWAGLSYRHVFPEIGTSGFSPFAQALVGGTQFGPIGRGSVGVMYSPVGPLSFMLGIEGSALGFTHQNQWFTSSKYGFTYGVAVRL